MSIQRVKTELLSIQPLDAIEQAHLVDALAWVDSGAPLFRVRKPATPPKHLVSYFAVIDRGCILLVDHKNARRWLPTGGHVEENEDPRATVVRELKEELGLRVAIENIAAPIMITVSETVGLSESHIDVSLWYRVDGNRDAEIEFDRDECHDARWFAFADVPLERCEPHLSRFLEKLRSKPDPIRSS